MFSLRAPMHPAKLTMNTIPPSMMIKNARLNSTSNTFSNLKPSPECHLSRTAYMPTPTSNAPKSHTMKLQKNMEYLTQPEMCVKLLGNRRRRPTRPGGGWPTGACLWYCLYAGAIMKLNLNRSVEDGHHLKKTKKMINHFLLICCNCHATHSLLSEPHLNTQVTIHEIALGFMSNSRTLQGQFYFNHNKSIKTLIKMPNVKILLLVDMDHLSWINNFCSNRTFCTKMA